MLNFFSEIKFFYLTNILTNDILYIENTEGEYHMENKKVKIYGIALGVILFILLVSGLTYAILSWRSSNITIAGNSECLKVDSVKGSDITGSDLLLLDESEIINNNQITITTGMVVTNITAKLKSSCTIDGYLTINLNTTTLNSGFTSSGNSTGALKYVLATYDPSTYTTVNTSALNGKVFDIVTTGSITSTGTLKIKETQLSKDTTLAYLVIFYIDGDKANNDIGSNSTNFKTSIEATVTQGTAPVNAASLISDLYNDATKTPVTNNSITYQYDTTNSLMKDIGDNIRYYGASPNNYIYFNCSDYSNQSSSTCETWRIIGVFNGKVKLMRGSQIGTYSWDNKNTSTGAETDNGKNDWTEARLMKLLNPGYESETTGGSLYYNSGSGNCYSEQNNATTTCDFASTGIKDTTRNLISDTTYSLLGWSTSSVYPNEIYEYERSTGKVYSGRPTEWTGKIALAYPSDYGYAVDLSKCGQNLYNYYNNTCTSNNWMKTIMAPYYGWLLTPNSGSAYFAWFVYSSGDVRNYYLASAALGVAPVLYLNSELSIKAGIGSSSNPYQLAV